mmetsp:Transcript_5716/g.12062  ORF Transcript_5716/g.12062 Transcript_5716/m.12062 type:complete len:182 (-) Transcript_5716:176-721(-)
MCRHTQPKEIFHYVPPGSENYQFHDSEILNTDQEGSTVPHPLDFQPTPVLDFGLNASFSPPLHRGEKRNYFNSNVGDTNGGRSVEEGVSIPPFMSSIFDSAPSVSFIPESSQNFLDSFIQLINENNPSPDEKVGISTHLFIPQMVPTHQVDSYNISTSQCFNAEFKMPRRNAYTCYYHCVN